MVDMVIMIYFLWGLAVQLQRICALTSILPANNKATRRGTRTQVLVHGHRIHARTRTTAAHLKCTTHSQGHLGLETYKTAGTRRQVHT